MATDSSSGTLPSSSRLTIDSSSSIARSNGIWPISLLSLLAMVRDGRLDCAKRKSGRRSFPLRAHQRGDVGGDGIAERLQIITAFQQRNDAAAGISVGDVHDFLRR